jgi:hypothetical protein
MIYISHRGNIDGPKPDFENEPGYIQKALDLGYEVEVDVWVQDETILLGHDKPEYEVTLQFLQNKRLWCHAKNFLALQMMQRNKKTIHFFSHDKDPFTLTSKGYIWTYPGNDISEKSILVMPETTLLTEKTIRSCYGICSDYILQFKRRCEAKHRVAMLISGRMTCYKECLKPKLDRFYAKNKDVHIDLFVSLNTELTDEVVQFKNDCLPAALYVQSYKCHPQYIYHPYIRPEYEHQRHMLANFMSHAYNNMVAMQILNHYVVSCSDVRYDYIILFRADIIADEIPLIDFKIEPSTIYFPSKNRYNPEWINMEILVGDLDTMMTYCSLYRGIEYYIYEQNICFHPETIATCHVQFNGLKLAEFSYDYELDKRRRLDHNITP